MTHQRPHSEACSATPLTPLAVRWLAKARSELNAGQPDAARGILAKVLALAPDNDDAIRLLALAAQQLHDHATAIACLRQALATRPHDPDLHAALGIALYRHGDADSAISHLRDACGLRPDSASTWLNLAEALQHQAHTAEAIDALQRALGSDPACVPARLSLARAHASIGRTDAAVREFREILSRVPEHPEAWFGLSNLNTVRFGTDDVELLRKACARKNLPAAAHDRLRFALAKALEDQADFIAAFDVFKAANASRRERIKWDAAGEHRRIDAIQRVFEDWSPPPSSDPERGHEVILIVSIPRSGSTLVEQILASHPEVAGANEITDMANVIDAESRRRQDAFPLWIPSTTAGDWQRLGNDYLARTARWRARKPRFTDKNLVAWYLVGAALAMLPAARVVVVRRDPLETCLACFRQWLSGDAGFACDLDEMADYCIDFMRLTRFWLQQFPDRVLDLEYEALVAQPEPAIRRLLEFCQLPFDQTCLDFHHTERTVQSSPSAAQVRQPLRRDTARAARYGDRLDHLRTRLRNAGLATGTGIPPGRTA